MRRLVLPLLALVLVGAACSSFGTAPAATVDGREISAKTLEDEMKTIRGNTDYVNAIESQFGRVKGDGEGTFDTAFAAQLLTLRIYYSILDDDLRHKGVELTGDMLESARSSVEGRFAGVGDKGLDGFPKWYRDELVHNAALVVAAQQHITDEIGDDPRAFYDENRDEFAVICLSHALAGVQDGKTPEEADALAQKWYDQIEAGDTTFEEVATKDSEDPGAAAGGGDLGCGSKYTLQFDPTFEAAAFALKPDVVSEPVQTQFGSHLILVRSREVPSYAEVQDQIFDVMQQAVGERIDAYFSQLLCGADVHVNPRYGSWSSSTCDAPVPTPPTVTVPEGPKRTTTTTAELG